MKAPNLQHMSPHIGDIETAMCREINLYIGRFPHAPTMEELMDIGVRLGAGRWQA